MSRPKKARFPGRPPRATLGLAVVCGTVLTLALVPSARAQSDVEDLTAGATSRHVTFDNGQGHLWLAPGSSVRRVGNSVTVDSGRALWAHPSATARLASSVGVEVSVDAGGVVGIDASDADVVVDVLAGRGTLEDMGTATDVRRGRYSAGSWSHTRDPRAVYGAAVAEPASASMSTDEQLPGGLLAVLDLSQPGAETSRTLDPDVVRVRGDIGAATANLRITAIWNDLPHADEEALGVIYAMPPAHAQLHDAILRLDDVVHYATRAEATGSLQTADALIPRPDPGRGFAERVTFSLPGDALARVSALEVEFEFTVPLSISASEAVLHLPLVPSDRDVQLGRLDVDLTAVGEIEVRSAVGTTTATGFNVSLENVRLDAGLAVSALATDDSKPLWAGRTPGIDGVFFFMEPAAEKSDVDPAERHDVVFVVDSEAGRDTPAGRHAAEVVRGWAGGLDEELDRMSLVSFGDEAETIVDWTAPGHDALRNLTAQMATPKARGANLDAGLEGALDQLQSARPDVRRTIVFVGRAQQGIGAPDALRQRFEALVEANVELQVVDLSPAASNVALQELQQGLHLCVLRPQPGLSGALTAARRSDLGRCTVRTLAPPAASTPNVDLLSRFPTWPGSWRASPGLLAGRYQSVGPLFDVPGEAELCVDRDEDGLCSQTLAIDLTRALRDDGLAIVHQVAARGGERSGLQLTGDATQNARLLERGQRLEFAELATAFELLYLERRRRGDFSIHQLPSLEQLAGIVAGEPASGAPVVPLPSTAEAVTTLGSMKRTRDPWVVGASAAAVAAPSISEVLMGQRSGSTGSSTGNAASGPGSSPPAGTVAGAVWNARQSSEFALTQAREAGLTEIGSDAKKIREYLVGWHEASLRSTSQLYTVQNHYYTHGLYDLATLVQYDIQAIDPWGNAQQRRGAITYFLDEKLWRRAEPLLRDGFARAPDDEFYADGLARVFSNTGRKAKAATLEIEALRRQLERAPDRPAELRALIGRLHQNGRADDAAVALEAWATTSGRSPTWYALRALVARLSGANDEAIETLRAGVDAFPRSRQARAELFDTLVGVGRLEEAFETATRWRELDPDNGRVLQAVADVEFTLGRTVEARDRYGALVTAFPDSPVGYVKVGDVLMRTGEPDLATAYFERALAAQPSNIAATLRVIDATARAGNLERAVEAFETLRASSPVTSNPEAGRTREELYHQLLLRWYTEAMSVGDDALMAKIESRMRQVYVDYGLFSYGTQSYGLRAALVIESTDSSLLVDFEIEEPGGYTVSYITAYNSALGSQLSAATGRSGIGPRVYWLPQAEDGAFTFRVTHEGPSGYGPLRAKLFVHRMPKPFSAYWEQHDIILEAPGDTFTVSASLDAPPTGNAVAPTSSF